MATEIDVANLALHYVGSKNRLTSGDGTLAASTNTGSDLEQLLVIQPHCRDLLLETVPWPFALSFVQLALADGGAGAVWTNEWSNAFTYPAGVTKVHRFTVDTQGDWSTSAYQPWGGGSMVRYDWAGQPQRRFAIRRHADAKVIMANVSATEARMEVSLALTDAAAWPTTFVEAVALMSAAKLALSSVRDSDLAGGLLAQANAAVQDAMASTLNEQRTRRHEPGRFVRARRRRR